MLVLSRVVGESLVIGEGEGQVEVCVLRVKGNQVRIGVNAPREVVVDRAEVAVRKRDEREQLGQAS